MSPHPKSKPLTANLQSASTHTCKPVVSEMPLWSKSTALLTNRPINVRGHHCFVWCKLARDSRRCSEECIIQISLYKHVAIYSQAAFFFTVSLLSDPSHLSPLTPRHESTLIENGYLFWLPISLLFFFFFTNFYLL